MNVLIILLTVAVSLIKLGQGLGVDIKHFVTHANRWLVFKGVIVAVVFVPILFLILLLIFQPTTAVALAIICLGVAPAADLSARQAKTLGGDQQLAESVLAIIALISIFTVPLLLKFFEITLGLHLNVQYSHVIIQVAIAQFMPMIISIILRYFFPKLVDFAKYIITGASLMLVICFIVFIILNLATFSEFKINGYVAIIIAISSAFVLGVLFAGKNPKNQIALAIESSMRSPGLAFLIASGNFAKERVDQAMAPFLVTMTCTIIICTLGLKLLQKYWK